MDKHNIWHRAYSAHYDHDQAGHPVRAKVWGWIADRLCDLFWSSSRGESR